MSKLTGNASGLTGDTSGIFGHCAITGDVSDLVGNVSRLTGDASGLTGRIHRDLVGNVSRLTGDVTGVYGCPGDLYGDVRGLHDITGLTGDAGSYYLRVSVGLMTDEHLAMQALLAKIAF